MKWKSPIQKYTMSFLKWFFIFSIFCIGFIWSAEWWLSFTVTWNKTSFSVSNYCHPNTISNTTITSYDEVIIKIWNTQIQPDCKKAIYINNYNYESYITQSPRYEYNAALLYENNSNWTGICYIKELEKIKIAPANWQITSGWNYEIRCNIGFKSNWTHTITIEDPLYDSTNAPNSWQINDINIWIEEKTYYASEQGNEGTFYYPERNYNKWNVTSIEYINWLPQLKTLDLSNNKISSTQFLLKNNAINVNNLEKLDLSNNNISSIYENDLGNFNSLKELNLSSNWLTGINSDTFKDSQIDNLEYLDLSKNKISNIEANSFYKFSSKLQELKLDWQKVDPLNISSYAFSWLSELKSLELQNNKIKTLVWPIFYWLTDIQNLNLENNQINLIRRDNWKDPFDNFAEDKDSTWQILINLSGNLIESAFDTDFWKALPDSLNSLVNRFKNGAWWVNLIFWPNNYLDQAPNYKLALNLTNNYINFIKITNTATSNNVNQTFNRFWYSYNHTTPKYRREIQNESWDVKQSWNITGNNGNNSQSVNLGESFKWTFHVYILSGSEKVAHDKVGVETQNNSTITISRETDNGFRIIENNTDIPFRIVKLKIEWHPSNVNVENYTYEITWTWFYLSWDFINSTNTFEKTLHFENWEYNITVIMYNEDGEVTRKSLNFNINVQYNQNKLQIIYPESSWLTSTWILTGISRTHDRNSKECRSNDFIDYWKYISWFLCELIDWNWTTHLSKFVKINQPKSRYFACRSTWYEINNLNLNLPNWRYTLSIKTLDIEGNEIGTPKTLKFDKWKIFTVIFNSNWWTPVPSKEIWEWEILSKPDDPTKTWYIFLEWYTDRSLTNIYDFRVHVISGFTLYAKRLEDNTIPPPELYSVTVNYSYANWGYATWSKTEYYESWQIYSITSPTISGYTPSQAIISWIMRNSNQTFNVTYTKNENPWPWNENTTTTSNSSDLYLKVSNKNPDIDERVKLTINVNEKYTWKILFPKLQYYNGSKRVNIYNTSSSYISDSSDELDDGQVQFRSSDEWSITISKFVKFSRSGKFRIYAEDKYWDDTYIQINVSDEDDNSSSSSSSSKSSSSSDESNLTLSVNSASQTIYEPIDLTIKTDNYVWKINLYAKYKELTSNYWLTLNNTSTEYLSDYSNIWENWYYKMTSSDKGKKTFSKLVEFKKPWTYRLYAEDANWYANFVQIYVNENNNTTSISSSNTKTNTWSSSENDEIEKLLRELLNKKWNNSSLSSSPNTSSPSTSSQSIERNKQNISSSNDEVYISRSCKEYRIQYNTWLWVFTSPDLKKAEYFINKDYFKRYIDSKNKQVEGCPTNVWWISTNYKDTSSSNEYYIAPNGKVYFFTRENWTYKSSWLTKDKQFQSLSEIKYYIRDRNPLIWMTNIK